MRRTAKRSTVTHSTRGGGQSYNTIATAAIARAPREPLIWWMAPELLRAGVAEGAPVGVAVMLPPLRPPPPTGLVRPGLDELVAQLPDAVLVKLPEGLLTKLPEVVVAKLPVETKLPVVKLQGGEEIKLPVGDEAQLPEGKDAGAAQWARGARGARGATGAARAGTGTRGFKGPAERTPVARARVDTSREKNFILMCRRG